MGTVAHLRSTAPEHLSAEAAQLWRDVQRDYQLDDAAASAVLLRLCESVDRIREAQKAILADGLITMGSRRQKRLHPAFAVEAEACRQFLACVRALNLDLAPPA